MGNVNTNGIENAAAQMYTEVKDSIQNVGEQVTEKAETLYNEVKSSGKEALDVCARTGKEQVHNVENFIKENPITSVIAAVATGFLLSRICKS